MRNVFILLALLLTSATAGAQTERRIYTSSELKSMQTRSEKSELTKEQKKQIEAIRDSIHYAQAIQSLETLEFVMEADQLVFKRGHTAFVTSNTNFISLSDDRAVVQIAPFHGGGPNGIGGITLEGKASNIRIKTDKKLYKGSNKASVTVNPNFHSNRVTLNGVLLPTEYSGVYKGRAF